MNINSIAYLGLSIILAGCGSSLGQAALNGLEKGGIPARSIAVAVGGGGARPVAQAVQSQGTLLDILIASDADPYWREMDALFQQQCIDRIRAIPVTENNLAAYRELQSRCFIEKSLRSNAVSAQLFFEVVDSPAWPRPKADLKAAGECYEKLVHRGNFIVDLHGAARLSERLKKLEWQRRFTASRTPLQAERDLAAEAAGDGALR